MCIRDRSYVVYIIKCVVYLAVIRLSYNEWAVSCILSVCCISGCDTAVLQWMSYVVYIIKCVVCLAVIRLSYSEWAMSCILSSVLYIWLWYGCLGNRKWSSEIPSWTRVWGLFVLNGSCVVFLKKEVSWLVVKRVRYCTVCRIAFHV